MSLSADLISQFVQVTKPKETKKEETTVYGVAKVQNGSYFVQLDGSELLTPMITTSEVVDGERIAVMIKNHKAICLGNVDSPAARIETVNELGTYLSNLIADKATIGELEAATAKIGQLEANDLTVNGKISAVEANISVLETGYAKIGMLESDFAEFENATAGNFTAVNARIDSLDVGNLQAEFAELKSTTTETLEAVDATIKNLDATYVNIDFSNITKANILDFYAASGVIADARIEDGKICGTLEAVTVKGDLIEAGTIAAEKLVLKGEDGLFYRLNYDGKNVTGTQTDYNSLHGKIITAKSITANQITVSDLVAFGAKLANFTIDDSADGTIGYIYSGAKATADSTLQGIYLDSNGQMNIGNSSNYIKFVNGKLDIKSDDVTFDFVKETATAAKDKVDSLSIGGRNYLTNAKRLNNFNLSTITGTNSFLGFDVSATSCPNGWKMIGGSGNNAAARLGKVIDSNGYWTISWEMRGSQSSAVSLYVDICDKGRTKFTTNATDTWEKYSLTVNVTNYSDTVYNFVDFENVEYAYFYIRNVKIEKGTQATDWTPAPEDVVASIEEVDAKVDLTNTGLGDLTNVINNMKIGDANLLNASNVPLSSKSYYIGQYIPSSPLVAGKKYTISVCFTPAAGTTYINAYLSTGHKYICQLLASGTEQQIVTKTFTCEYLDGKTPEDDINNSKIYFFRFPEDGTVTEMTTIHWAKVVEGNTPTTSEWTPSWDDVYGAITDASKSAVDFIKPTDTGLIVGRYENEEAQTFAGHVRIDSDSVDIRYGSNTLASFGSNTIYLGNNGQTTTIDLCNGLATLSAEDNIWSGQMLLIDSGDEVRLTASGRVSMQSSYDMASAYITAYSRDQDVYTEDSAGIELLTSNSGDEARIWLGDTSWGSNAAIIMSADGSDAVHIRSGMYMNPNGEKFDVAICGSVYADDGYYMPNNTPIRMLNKDGSAYYRVMALSDGDSLHIGVHDDKYSNDPLSVKSNIWLTAKNLWFKIADPIYKEFKPYYTKNDTIKFGTAANALCTTAYISSSSKTVYFVVPVSKPILSTTVTAETVSGFKVRQENQYLYGSSASTYAKPASYTATVIGGGAAVGVWATFSTTTNVINNHVCGIEASIKLTFG